MERPIILKAHEVRGILDGRQHQLRRIVKLPKARGEWEPTSIGGEGTFYLSNGKSIEAPAEAAIWNPTTGHCVASPFGQVGDHLWGREAWQFWEDEEAGTGPQKMHGYATGVVGFNHRADYVDPIGKWRSSSNMPRDASRILLEIVSVRVERLQDISQADAKACGFHDGGCLTCGNPSHPSPCGCQNPRPDHVDSFAWQWHEDQGEAGPKSFDANPWVWVVEFKRVDAA